MTQDVVGPHQAFDDMLGSMEAGKISRERIADVVTRLMISAPNRPAQSEIAQGRGLALPSVIPADSVSRVTTALTRMNLLTQHKPRADRPGRPYIPLQLGSSRWAMVGVKVGHAKGRAVTFNVLVTGLDGAPLNLPGYQAEDEPYIRSISEGDDFVEALGEVIEELCDLPAMRHRTILGVGVEVAGHVHRGTVMAASLNNMNGVSLGGLLSKRLDRLADRFDDRKITRDHRPLPVIIDNDVNVLAVLETYKPRFPERDIAVVAVFDDGIGSGLIVNGNVYRGGGGMAGEIGHCFTPIDAKTVADIGEPTSSPNTEVSGQALDVSHAETQSTQMPGFLDPCHCGHPCHLDCLTPVRVLGQLGEHDLATIARRPARLGEQLAREGRAFQIAGQGLGIGLSNLVNLINPSRVLLFLPPDLAQPQPGSGAELYCDEIRKTLREHSFSNAARETVLEIEPLSAEQRRFFGAKAAAVRILDSFVQHAKKLCWCYDPRREPESISSIETNFEETDSDRETDDNMAAMS